MAEEEKQYPEPLTSEEIGLQLMALRLSVGKFAIIVEQLERRMQKWDEVYYHVFPDRLAQDVKFENQMLDLIPSIRVEPEKNKS